MERFELGGGEAYRAAEHLHPHANVLSMHVAQPVLAPRSWGRSLHKGRIAQDGQQSGQRTRRGGEDDEGARDGRNGGQAEPPLPPSERAMPPCARECSANIGARRRGRWREAGRGRLWPSPCRYLQRLDELETTSAASM